MSAGKAAVPMQRPDPCTPKGSELTWPPALGRYADSPGHMVQEGKHRRASPQAQAPKPTCLQTQLLKPATATHALGQQNHGGRGAVERAFIPSSPPGSGWPGAGAQRPSRVHPGSRCLLETQSRTVTFKPWPVPHSSPLRPAVPAQCESSGPVPPTALP